MIVQQRVSPPVLQTVSASRPSLIERAFIALCLIVQQGAFISLPLTMAGESTRGIDNPYNTVGVAESRVDPNQVQDNSYTVRTWVNP